MENFKFRQSNSKFIRALCENECIWQVILYRILTQLKSGLLYINAMQRKQFSRISHETESGFGINFWLKSMYLLTIELNCRNNLELQCSNVCVPYLCISFKCSCSSFLHICSSDLDPFGDLSRVILINLPSVILLMC